MNNRTKKQHFVPRFYLRQFCNTNGELWTHDSQQKSARQTTPENTAYETNIYTPLDDDGNRIDMIETYLSEVENKAAIILPELLDKRPLNTEAKRDFSTFLATMFTRSPAQIRQIATQYGELANWAGDHIIEHLNQEKRAAGTLTDFDLEMQELYHDKSKYKMDVDRRMGLNAFHMVPVFTQLMQNMCWTFEVSQNQQLVTSDNPFFWIATKPLSPKIPYGFGLGHSHAVIPFPLSPNLILRIDWQKSPNWTKHVLEKQRARLANQNQAKYKNRFLYFKEYDGGFCRLGMKYNEQIQQIRSSVNAPPINIVRKLPKS